MNNKFTPGPWEIKPFKSTDKNIIIERPGVRVDNDDVDPEEAKANAILIAAAPDLLAACEFALSVQMSAGLYDVSDRLNAEKLRFAISKAKEES